MADNDYNIIKPVESLDRLNPVRPREEKRRRKKQQQDGINQAEPPRPEEEVPEDQDNLAGYGDHTIDYRA